MKKILKLGKTLTKSELKVVIGGSYGCIALRRQCIPGGMRCCIGRCDNITVPGFSFCN